MAWIKNDTTDSFDLQKKFIFDLAELSNQCINKIANELKPLLEITANRYRKSFTRIESRYMSKQSEIEPTKLALCQDTQRLIETSFVDSIQYFDEKSIEMLEKIRNNLTFGEHFPGKEIKELVGNFIDNAKKTCINICKSIEDSFKEISLRLKTEINMKCDTNSDKINNSLNKLRILNEVLSLQHKLSNERKSNSHADKKWKIEIRIAIAVSLFTVLGLLFPEQAKLIGSYISEMF